MVPYYRESWRVHPLRFAVVGLGVLVLGGALGAVVGAAAAVHVVAGLVVAALAGPALGWVLRRSLPSAYVRNTPLACALGLAAGGLATWAAAAAWLYRATAAAGDEAALLCLAPDCLAWALPRLTPPGVVADVWVVPASTAWCWGLGALALVGPPLAGAWLGVRDRVFCEGCGRPADETVRIYCQAIDEPALFRRGLEEEHYESLLRLYPGDPRDSRHSVLTLEDCTGCEGHSYLTIVSVGPKGKVTPVVRRLALWRDVFGELQRRVVGEWSQAHTELVDR